MGVVNNIIDADISIINKKIVSSTRVRALSAHETRTQTYIEIVRAYPHFGTRHARAIIEFEKGGAIGVVCVRARVYATLLTSNRGV